MIDSRIEVGTRENEEPMRIYYAEDVLKAPIAYLGLLKVLAEVKHLHDAVAMDGTTSGGWKVFTTWYDNTNKGTKFRVQRDFERLAMVELEPPNNHLPRAYVFVEQMEEAGLDCPDI